MTALTALTALAAMTALTTAPHLGSAVRFPDAGLAHRAK